MRDALRDAPLQAVYSSPLARALDTAHVIAEPHNLPIRCIDGLSEIQVGEWEGLTIAEIETRYVEAVFQWYNIPYLARIPGERPSKRCGVARTPRLTRSGRGTSQARSP